MRPLIPNALKAGLAALRRRGHYPINHTVVIKDDLLARDPELAADVFDAFVRAKRAYVDRLKGGAIDKPTATDQLHRRVMEIAGDPLPYGIEPNRKVLEELIGHALKQGIISRRVAVDDLFARGTHRLVG